MRRFWLPSLVLAATAGAASAQPAGAPDPATVELFVAKCASCHTVGKGNRVGPDLKGAVERRGRPWVERFVATPSTMLDTDAQARDLLKQFGGVRMPDLGITGEQAAQLAGLIAHCTGAECDLQGKFTPVTETTAEHVALGRDLFTGRAALQNGASPCLSCHAADGAGVRIAGGTFSKDLTHVYARLGDEGLDAALKAPAFRVMGKVFAERPLTAAEALALRAFLHDSNRGGGVAAEPLSLPLVAFLGALAALWVLNALWARRLRGVRSTLVPRPRQEKAS